jgi:hypothetical protein
MSGVHPTPFALSSGLSLSKTACRRGAAPSRAGGFDKLSLALRQAQGERSGSEGERKDVQWVQGGTAWPST